MTESGHISADEIELYSLDRISEPDLSRVEEHLLVCEYCRQRLAEEDRFSKAAKAALERLNSLARGDAD
ncbi:MAG: hypothetical protein ACM3ZB_03440 [bacterium]|jgi:anti-sigma factor RsiW